jgi:hypothetical protein
MGYTIMLYDIQTTKKTPNNALLRTYNIDKWGMTVCHFSFFVFVLITTLHFLFLHIRIINYLFLLFPSPENIKGNKSPNYVCDFFEQKMFFEHYFY